MRAFNRLVCGVAMMVLTASGGSGQTTQPRDVKAISADLSADMEKMHEVMGPGGLPLKPEARSAVAPKVIPILNRISTELGELAAAQPEAKDEISAALPQFVMMRAYFGDKASIEQLQRMAASKDPTEALDGKSNQLLIQWFSTNGDAAAQGKVVDEVETLAKGHAESDDLARQVLTMSELGGANPALTERINDLILNVLKSPQATVAQQEILQVRKLREMENKPLVISGKLVDGKPFTTADWKGKVVLVDFWATWCGPCVEELPRVKKAYADFHTKGLEVLGISNDYAAADLTQFLGQNKDMPWPQLFDATAAAQQAWHPVTLGFGIGSIPTMFLIDKKGILRESDARRDFETEIPTLLGE